MLVLTRRIGEVVVINDSISITVIDVSGSRAKLGITAPSEVPIHRPDSHVYRQTVAGNDAAQPAEESRI